MTKINPSTFAALTILALIAAPGFAQEHTRHTYAVTVQQPAAGGPLRSANLSVVEAPQSLAVTTDKELDAEKQARIAWHFRNAARLAESFAQKKGLTMHRQVLPDRVEMFKSPEALARALNLPEHDRLGYVVARINLRSGTVYLGRNTPEDLYVELGKWVFYPHRHRWGLNADADRKLLDVAEDFASFCLKEKNWVEAGGSNGAIR